MASHGADHHPDAKPKSIPTLVSSAAIDQNFVFLQGFFREELCLPDQSCSCSLSRVARSNAPLLCASVMKSCSGFGVRERSPVAVWERGGSSHPPHLPSSPPSTLPPSHPPSRLVGLRCGFGVRITEDMSLFNGYESALHHLLQFWQKGFNF